MLYLSNQEMSSGLFFVWMIVAQDRWDSFFYLSPNSAQFLAKFDPRFLTFVNWNSQPTSLYLLLKLKRLLIFFIYHPILHNFWRNLIPSFWRLLIQIPNRLHCIYSSSYKDFSFFLFIIRFYTISGEIWSPLSDVC